MGGKAAAMSEFGTQLDSCDGIMAVFNVFVLGFPALIRQRELGSKSLGSPGITCLGILGTLLSFVVCGWFVYVGALHVDDPRCDTDFTGDGLGEWMLVQGVFMTVILILQCCDARLGCEYLDKSTTPGIMIPCIGPLYAFLFCWWIYGQVLSFRE